MKRWLLALALLINHGLLIDRAKAQDAPQTFTLTVTLPELQTLGNGLDSQPYGVTWPLVAKLKAQIDAQQKAKEPKAEEKK